MSVERNKRILQKGAESFNDPSARSGWIDIHDPEVVAHGLAAESLDRSGVEAFYSLLWSAFPDLRISVDDMVGEGDRVAWRLTVKGTHEGEFRGVSPTGVAVTFGAQYLFRFRDGAIVERWTNFDRLGVMVQLGAIPAPV